MKFANRLPRLNDLYPVYGLIVMLVYGWSLYHFIWLLPSWLKFLNLLEIGSILSYMLVTNLVESLLILTCLVIASVILPPKWFLGNFTLRAGLSALYILILVMIAAQGHIPAPYRQPTYAYAIEAIVGFALLQWAFGKVRILGRLLEILADRSVVFLYVSVPSSVFALVTVFIRNI